MAYRLTKAVPVHGCSCKLPQYELGLMLEKAGLTGGFGADVLAGPWENSSVVRIADGIAILNTLDFFTPMVDEPEIQGRIAGSNVTSDIYALAVTKIASVLTIMAFPENMPSELAVGMLKGFGDFAAKWMHPSWAVTPYAILAYHRRRSNRRWGPRKNRLHQRRQAR